MEGLDLSTEDLARRYAPDLIPQTGDTRVAAHVVVSLTTLTFAMIFLGALGATGPVALGGLGLSLIAGIAGGEVLARRHYTAELQRFNDEIRAAPWRLYDAISAGFSREIAQHRARTLGPASDWGRARVPMETAFHETERSLAYWEQRCAMEPANEVAQQQRDTALRLRDKFQQALAELDARARVLVAFFNECDARLAVLQFAKRDHEEVNKLGALSERADDIVSDAQNTLRGISNAFLSEAIRVGHALASIEQAAWIGVADTVSIDRLETVADRILESSVHEESMLAMLTDDEPARV